MNLEKVTQAINKYYFCQRDVNTFYLSDDRMICFEIVKDKLVLNNYNFADFSKFYIDGSISGVEQVEYNLPTDFETLVELLFQHELIGSYEDDLESSKQKLINIYYAL